MDIGEGNTGRGAKRESRPDPAQSETLSTRGSSFHGNREVPRVPDTGGVSGRPEKGNARASGMHARGKSDGRIVPEKPTNNGESLSPAEPKELQETA